MAGDDPLLPTAGSWTLPHPVWVAGSERTGERFENALGLAWRAPARSLRAELAGSRIRVQDIYIWHEVEKQTVDEIVARFPQLTHADVHASLAYYWDHKEELDRNIERRLERVERIRHEVGPSHLVERLKAKGLLQ